MENTASPGRPRIRKRWSLIVGFFTAFIAILALVAYKRYSERERAIEKIEEVGGTVLGQPILPKWVTNRIGEEYSYRKMKVLYFGSVSLYPYEYPDAHRHFCGLSAPTPWFFGPFAPPNIRPQFGYK